MTRKWLVPSFSDKTKFYVVKILPNGTCSCNCPDFLYRKRKQGLHCKHILLVQKNPENPIVKTAELYVPALEKLLVEPPSLIGFDCTGSLEIENGIVKLETVKAFKQKGWIVGIISNRVTHKKFSPTLRNLGLDFYVRGGLGHKSFPMLDIARKFQRTPSYYAGNDDRDEQDSVKAKWIFVDVRKVAIKVK